MTGLLLPQGGGMFRLAPKGWRRPEWFITLLFLGMVTMPVEEAEFFIVPCRSVTVYQQPLWKRPANALEMLIFGSVDIDGYAVVQ